MLLRPKNRLKVYHLYQLFHLYRGTLYQFLALKKLPDGIRRCHQESLQA
jgi:hypothetical protein